MKISVVLGGLLVLFVLTHGSDDVSVACSEHWLQVKIRRKSYVNYLQPQSYELHLGTGCPVTRELLDFFEFFYGLSSCGIKVNERPSSILIESSVTYEPVSLDIIGHIPISCYIQRPFLFTFVTKTELNTSSAFQSLVRKNNSASPKVEDTEIHPGVSFENNFSPVKTYIVLSAPL